MIKKNQHIEIVCSSVIALSSMSQASRVAVQTALAKYYTRVGITIVNNLADLQTLVALKPDLVFLGVQFVPIDSSLDVEASNKVWVSEFLDTHSIVHTGSGKIAHDLEHDKALAKQCVLDAGLKTSPFYVVKQSQVPFCDLRLAFPLFVKPTDRGGGLGIDSNSVVRDFDELQAKIQSIAVDFQADSLVEEYLPGREFSVAILKDEHSAEFSVMPIELIAPLDERGARILSEQVKASDTERFIEVTDLAIKASISSLAINVFHALGARDYGRIDIRLDKFGTPQFLEANLIPSLINGYGNFPKACMLNINLGYEQMLLTIVRLAFARHPNPDKTSIVTRHPFRPMTRPMDVPLAEMLS